MLPPAAVLIDIEGTTTPVAFVQEVLYPFARARLDAFLAGHGAEELVARELAEVRRMGQGQPELATLLHWMDVDAKLTPLKTLQGMIWREGYDAGVLRGEIYPDVAPALHRWCKAGLRLAIYSAGSVEAQRQVFGHSVAGDLLGLLTGFFDTRVGGKREPESYGRLAIGMGLPPIEVLYLSRVEEELDAAAAAGLRTCQVVRDGDGTEPSARHPTASDFTSIEVLRQFA